MLITEQDYWDVMKTFFVEEGLVKQHLDSYNDFVQNTLQQIIDEIQGITIEVPGHSYNIKFGTIEVDEPRIEDIGWGVDIHEEATQAAFRNYLRDTLSSEMLSDLGLPDLAEVRLGDVAAAVGRPVHCGVVHHNHLPVARQANVTLDGIHAEVHRPAEAHQCVLRLQPRGPAVTYDRDRSFHHSLPR